MTDPPDGPLLRPGRRMLLRAAFAGALIVLCTAGATATGTLLAIKDIPAQPEIPGPRPETEPTRPGRPQTLLLLGSDRRWADKKSDPARSDTLMLVRIDPHAGTSVLSIPRDLRVQIPGHGLAKINDAYALGGPALTLETLKALTGLRVHHVINVNFRGFKDAVDLLGCFYVDVDRRYFHSNAGLPVGQRYAEIDIQPGYQRVCGSKALDYVRFRHADSDIVRSARQQDFLRAAKDQLSTSAIIHDLGGLTRVFAQATQTDRGLRSTAGRLRLGKLAVYAAGKPVRQVSFPAQFVRERDADYVVADPAAVLQAADEFLHPERAEVPAVAAPRAGAGSRSTKRRARRSRDLRALVTATRMVDARVAGRRTKARARRQPGLAMRFPRYLTLAGRYTETAPSPRTYTLTDPTGGTHPAYRMVIVQNVLNGSYYGVQGTTWSDPPAFAHPTSVVRVGGRRLELFRSGRRIRFVAWRSPRAVYWISNTLTLSLQDDEMLALAASLTTR